jgi:YfiH family protein
VTSGTLHGASWLVTDRSAGASQGAFAFNNLAVHVGDDVRAVARNRAAVAQRLGVPSVVFARAAHSNRVAQITQSEQDVPGVDALITDRADLALAAQGADCVMVAMATVDGWIAAVHCGWKGLVEQIVPNTLRALTAAGADLHGARAHLGPSICAACYQVDAQRAEEVRMVAPDAVVATSSGVGVDVRAGVRKQLHDHQVQSTADPRCTAEDPGLYSYRRDGVTGRQAIVVARRSA